METVPCKACFGSGKADPAARAYHGVYACDGCKGSGVHALALPAEQLREIISDAIAQVVRSCGSCGGRGSLGGSDCSACKGTGINLGPRGY